jgi:hypothetical protein
MVGSDVDPYAQIGSTKLFAIVASGNNFTLALAADSNSQAFMVDTTSYSNTDEGILQLYNALLESSIFPSVNYPQWCGGVRADSI